MSILKNVLSIFTSTPNRDKKAYLDQFVIPYELRTTSEKILTQALYKIEFDFCQGSSLYRHLGAIEAVLILENVLEYAVPFNYINGESYQTFMCRVTRGYLTDCGVILEKV